MPGSKSLKKGAYNMEDKFFDMRNKVFIAIIISIMLFGCTSKETQYQGSFEGRSYRFVNLIRNQIFSKAYSQQLSVDGLSALSIDDKTTSKGYPYNLAIYGQVPHVILDSHSYTYKNGYDDTAQNLAVLYVSPEKFSEADFKYFASFFSREWLVIKNKVPLSQGYRNLQIVALVYGTDEQFTRKFKNNSTKTTIEVWTDGQIHYRTGDAIQSTNLSAKVQMPGNKIYLLNPFSTFTPESLKEYKDQNGKPVYDYFTIEERQ